MKPVINFLFIAMVLAGSISQAISAQDVAPVRTEVIQPIRNETFNKNGTFPERKLGGNPRMLNNVLVFDGANDGNRQVDPQIAVGGEHVLHGTNQGLIIYTKKGDFVQGVSTAALIQNFSTMDTIKYSDSTFGIRGIKKKRNR